MCVDIYMYICICICRDRYGGSLHVGQQISSRETAGTLPNPTGMSRIPYQESPKQAVLEAA